MITQADYQDIDQLSRLAFEFLGDSLEEVGLECDYASVYDFILAMVEHPDMVLFVDKQGDEVRGVVGGQVRPWPFNRNLIVLDEMAWFVPERYRDDPSIGSRLFVALTRWGKKKGASTIVISSNIRAESDTVCRFYTKIGAKLTDKTFMGRLK